MIPPGAYIKGRPRISPILPRAQPGRTLSSPALANGEGRGTDILGENCRFMRRDVDKAASLRTDPSIYALYGIICAQRRQSGNVSAHGHIKGCSFGRPSEQISLGKKLLTRLYAIPAFPSIVFPAKLCLSLISHTGFCW